MGLSWPRSRYGSSGEQTPLATDNIRTPDRPTRSLVTTPTTLSLAHIISHCNPVLTSSAFTLVLTWSYVQVRRRQCMNMIDK